MNSCACGCGERPRGAGSRFCHGHWAKANRVAIGQSKRANRATNHGDGYLTVRVESGRHRLQHVVVAERALGKRLPSGAVVHHVDENRSNNEPTNLVICPNDAYHRLIHLRMRAFDACGHADWRKCYLCGHWDVTSNLHIPKRAGTGSIFHLTCLNASRAQKRAAA